MLKRILNTLACLCRRMDAAEAAIEAGGGGGGDPADLPEWITDLDEDGISINASDEMEIVKDGVTYWIPLNRR